MSPLLERLRTLEAGAELLFSLHDLPLDELLLTLHERRFTGALEAGDEPQVDRVYFREGGVVGVVPHRHLDAQLLGQVLVDMKKLTREALEAFLAEHRPIDGILFGQRLLARGLIDEDSLERACAEQARRRLFHLYDLPNVAMAVREGLHRLARFHPTYVDLRPAVAYGMVVRADAERRADMVRRARSKTARLISSYDEARNGYGLPPPVLAAMRQLSGQPVRFDQVPKLDGLTPEMTAGLLLLLHRMSLLRLE